MLRVTVSGGSGDAGRCQLMFFGFPIDGKTSTVTLIRIGFLQLLAHLADPLAGAKLDLGKESGYAGAVAKPRIQKAELDLCENKAG